MRPLDNVHIFPSTGNHHYSSVGIIMFSGMNEGCSGVNTNHNIFAKILSKRVSTRQLPVNYKTSTKRLQSGHSPATIWLKSGHYFLFNKITSRNSLGRPAFFSSFISTGTPTKGGIIDANKLNT